VPEKARHASEERIKDLSESIDEILKYNYLVNNTKP